MFGLGAIKDLIQVGGAQLVGSTARTGGRTAVKGIKSSSRNIGKLGLRLLKGIKGGSRQARVLPQAIKSGRNIGSQLGKARGAGIIADNLMNTGFTRLGGVPKKLIGNFRSNLAASKPYRFNIPGRILQSARSSASKRAQQGARAAREVTENQLLGQGILKLGGLLTGAGSAVGTAVAVKKINDSKPKKKKKGLLKRLFGKK